MPRAVRLSVLACALGLATGCGGGESGGGGDADPASIAPASAPAYVESVVKPEGAEKDDILAAAGKLLRTDEPEKRIRELFDQASKEGGGAGTDDLDYDRDVKPWVGERAGISFANLQGEDPAFVLAVAAKDTDKAQKALDDALKRGNEKTKDGSYKDVDYKVDDEGIAAGIIEDFLAIGNEAQFKQAIDASKGDSLADAKRFKDATADLEDERIGEAFFDVSALFDAAAKADPAAAAQADQLKSVIDVRKLQPVGAALLADGERIAVETSASTEGGGRLLGDLSALSGAGATPLVGELPGDSWVAYGVPKLGETGKALYDAFAGALGGAAIAEQFRGQTGLDLQQDVFSWIGDTALFVRGTDEQSLEGALVIEATDPAKAKRAVTKIVGVASRQGVSPRPTEVEGAETAFQVTVPGAPKPVIVAVGNDRAVLALGEEAAKDGLEAGEKLADADAFKKAEETLGGDAKPSVYIAMPELLKVLESMGQTSDPDYAKAKPYLDTLSSIVSGGEKEGDRVRSRFAVGLK